MYNYLYIYHAYPRVNVTFMGMFHDPIYLERVKFVSRTFIQCAILI